MTKILITLGAVLSVNLAVAQYIDREPTLDGILRPEVSDNLQWNHSFGVSAISSNAGFSSQSMYLSHVTWQPASHLQLKLDFGLLQATHPQGVYGAEQPRLIGGGELLWRPTDNTLFSFSLQHGPRYSTGWPGFMNYDYTTQQ